MDQYPPFPDDLLVITLPKLSSAKLLANDLAESKVLFDASVDYGFFQLDLSDTPGGGELLNNVQTAFTLGRAFFQLDEEEKKLYPLDKSNIGYGPLESLD